MRCNRHVSDLSSSIGVCASCLRDRLFVLIAAQVEENRRKTEERRKTESHHHHHHQTPLVFPRSVSPYICRRSDDSSWHNNNDRRFYSTPQIGPTFDSFNDSTTKKKHSSSSKFSLLKILFRSSRSEVSDFSDPRVPKTSFTSTNSSPLSTTSSSSSHSWLSSLVPSRRKKLSRFVDPPVIHYRKDRDRGMSPANVDRDFDGEDETPSSSESSPGWKKSTAQTAPPVRRRGGSTVHSKSNVSGLAFCLSPLVRASPNHRNQKDGSNIGFSGEIPRKQPKKHLSAAASLCTNRSRKLADFGRYNYNP